MSTTHSGPDPGASKPAIRFGDGFRLIGTLVNRHRWPFSLAVIGSAIYALATVAAAEVLGWAVDRLYNPEQAEPSDRTAVLVAAAVGAVGLVRAAGVVARRWYAGMTSERVSRWVRDELSEHYLRQPLSWLEERPTGRLLGHVDSDNRVLVEMLHPLPFAVGVLVLVVASSVQLVRIDPWIALLALVLFPVMFVTNSIYSRIVERPLATVQERDARMAGIAHESFTGALVVKTLGRREDEMRRFREESQQLSAVRRQTRNIRAVFDAVLFALPGLGSLAVILIAWWRVRDGAMSVGDIVTVAALFSALVVPMLVFGFLLESMVPSVVAWRRLSPVLSESLPEHQYTAGTTRPIAAKAASVELVNVTHRWAADHEPVLRDISVRVQPGECVAIVGATAAGKSTLCEIITGLRTPTEGQVLLQDRLITELGPHERAATIALVPQEAWMFTGTIRSNVDPVGASTDTDVGDALSLAAIDDWVRSLPDGLDTVVGERGITLSGGQRQRMALARCLLHPPGLVVLDDVTSALDTVLEAKVLDTLTDLDITVLLIANRPSTLQRADRVLHLDNARIANVGTHAELLASSHDYASIVSSEELA